MNYLRRDDQIDPNLKTKLTVATSNVMNLDKKIDKIFQQMDDYTIFHDRNDGDFKSPGDTYLTESQAKQAIKQLILEARVDELEQQSNVTLGILDANKCMKLLSERHIRRSIELNNQIKGDK